MTASDIERYRTQLQDMRSRLREEIQESIEAIREEAHVPGEDTKEPSEGLDHEQVIEETQRQLREQVMAALERIEAGTFGRCLDCGADVPSERLDALPFTPYCVSCERVHERT